MPHSSPLARPIRATRYPAACSTRPPSRRPFPARAATPSGRSCRRPPLRRPLDRPVAAPAQPAPATISPSAPVGARAGVPGAGCPRPLSPAAVARGLAVSPLLQPPGTADDLRQFSAAHLRAGARGARAQISSELGLVIFPVPMFARDFPSKAYAPRTVITRVDGTTTDRTRRDLLLHNVSYSLGAPLRKQRFYGRTGFLGAG